MRFVVFFLGFFTMLTNFFFSQSLLTAAAMLVALLGLLTALVNAHMPVGRPPLRGGAHCRAGWRWWGAPSWWCCSCCFRAAGARCGASPATPERAQRPVGPPCGWATLPPGAGRHHRLRVKFERAATAADLYFRGPVLTRFDGREWRPLQPLGARVPPMQFSPANLRVRGPLRRSDDGAEQPALAHGAGRGHHHRHCRGPNFLTQELQWVAERPLTDIVRYRPSHPQFSWPAAHAGVLPRVPRSCPGFNPRTLQLALDIRRDPRTPRPTPRPGGRGAGAPAHGRLHLHWSPVSTASTRRTVLV